MNKISLWVANSVAQYGWSIDFAREITLFLCICARILRELTRTTARKIIARECTFHGARAQIDSLVNTIYTLTETELNTIKSSPLHRIICCAPLRRIVLRIVVRVAPLTVSSRKNTIIEYTNTAQITNDDSFNEYKQQISALPLTMCDVSSTADIIVYNAIGMRSLVTLLVREVFSRNVTSIIVILHDEDIAINDAYWVSRAHSGKKISIWCKSERKICAILDITQ
jgi:hypothetical protein